MKLFVSDKEIRRIQAMAAEGASNPVDIESFLTSLPLSSAGDERQYRTYSEQVAALYRKYNGRDKLGNPQARALVDLRQAAIAGEGISIQAENKNTAKWINHWLDQNRLKGSKWFQWAQAGEMAGKCLINIIADNTSKYARACHFPYSNGTTGIDYNVTLRHPYDFDTVNDVLKKNKIGGMEPLKLKHFQYVKLGGDDTDVNQTTTRIGLCLHEMESYARALNGIRKNNHLFSRITPTFKTSSLSETNSLVAWIKAVQWKVGQIFTGTAEMKYIGPPTTAHENYRIELSECAKVISACTGMPVHWIGHVDMMSNRATAAELYDLINNATIKERTVWAEALKEVIIKAMQVSIDAGYETKENKKGEAMLKTPDRNFTVNIPVMSWTKMEAYVKSLSLAFSDGVISDQDYQGALPNIDPYVTNERLKAMKQEDAKIAAAAIAADMPDDEPEEDDPPEN